MSVPTGVYKITVPHGDDGFFHEDGSTDPRHPLLILPPSGNPENSKVRQAAIVIHSFLPFPSNFAAIQWLVEDVSTRSARSGHHQNLE